MFLVLVICVDACPVLFVCTASCCVFSQNHIMLLCALLLQRQRVRAAYYPSCVLPILQHIDQVVCMFPHAMKRARITDAPGRDRIVRLNTGGQIFHTSRETLYGSVFFRSLLKFDFDGDKDKDNNIFVDRSGKLFEELLESMRTKRRPHQRVIDLWKHQLLEKCKFFGTDEVAARIMGRTVETDLSPQCQIIAAEERDLRGHLIDVFKTPLNRKDVEELQLPPLLLANARARALQDRVLAGNKSHCRDVLNTHMGGILCALERDPVVCSCVVVAGGSVVAALTGASTGLFFLLVLSLPFVKAVALAQVHRIIL